jgi:hypothetical protein
MKERKSKMKSTTGHGGARLGAGRKRKPAAEKIINGDPGKRPIRVIPCDGIPVEQAVDMISPAEWLTAETKNAQRNLGGKIFEETIKWIKDRRCEHVITVSQVRAIRFERSSFYSMRGSLKFLRTISQASYYWSADTKSLRNNAS